jgi:hypothetical protein
MRWGTNLQPWSEDWKPSLVFNSYIDSFFSCGGRSAELAAVEASEQLM